MFSVTTGIINLTHFIGHEKKVYFQKNWNQKANDLGLWYTALKIWAQQSLLNNNPDLTLTYLMARSNLFPSAFKWEKPWKIDVLISVKKPKSFIDMFSLIVR